MDIQTHALPVSGKFPNLKKGTVTPVERLYSNVRICTSSVKNFEWVVVRGDVLLRPLLTGANAMYKNTEGPKAGGSFGTVWIFDSLIVPNIKIAVKRFHDDDDAELRVYDALSSYCADSRVQGCKAMIHIKREGHPTIVKPIVIMEFALYNLEHYITLLHNGNPWDINTIKQILYMVADAVVCIHDKTSMWYTDLKLENILVVENDPLKVTLGDIGSLCIDGIRCSHTFSEQFSNGHWARTTPERHAIIGMVYVAKCIILRRTSGGVNQAYDSEEMNAQMFDEDRNHEEIETYHENVLRLPADIMDCNNFDEIYALIDALD
jgi:hypothetical protein